MSGEREACTEEEPAGAAVRGNISLFFDGPELLHSVKLAALATAEARGGGTKNRGDVVRPCTLEVEGCL